MPQVEQVSKAEYLEWRGTRVTKRFIQDLYEKREAIKEGLVELSHSSDQERFVDIGRAQALKDVIDWAIFEFDYIGKYDDVESSVTSSNSEA